MVDWPSTLPQKPLQGDFEERPPNLDIESPTDTGPGKARRRYTAGARPITLSFHMTAEQLEYFDAFYVQMGKVSRWNWTNPRTGVTSVYRFTGDPPSYKSAGGVNWIISFTAKQMPT